MKGENTMTKKLLALFLCLAMTLERPTVRGWIMDEFKRRDAEAYESWCDDDDLDASPRKYFLN